jgi:hypothetical protein
MLPILIEETIKAKRRSISKHENMHYVWVLDWWQQWLRQVFWKERVLIWALVSPNLHCTSAYYKFPHNIVSLKLDSPVHGAFQFLPLYIQPKSLQNHPLEKHCYHTY